MKFLVKSITPQTDGSNDYLINMSGVSAAFNALPTDIQAALQDGKISVEEGVKILSDVVDPAIAAKLMGFVMLARMFGLLK